MKLVKTTKTKTGKKQWFLAEKPFHLNLKCKPGKKKN
jgi:hypothetical protein